MGYSKVRQEQLSHLFCMLIFDCNGKRGDEIFFLIMSGINLAVNEL